METKKTNEIESFEGLNRLGLLSEDGVEKLNKLRSEVAQCQ